MEHLSVELLAGPLRIIANKNEKSRDELSRFLTKPVWTPQDRQCILNSLAQLLLDKDYTLLLGRQLRPILLDLLERNAEAIKTGGQVNHDLHERLSVSMSKLIGNHPDVLPFALRYFKDTYPVFQRLFLESSDANPVRYGRRRMKLRDLMEAAHTFLRQRQPVFRELWDWSVCVPLLRSHDALVRWHTANCLALVTCMNEEHKLVFLRKIFSSDELVHFRLRLLEEAQLQDLEKALVLANPKASLWHKGKEQQYIQGHLVSADLSSSVTAVCGVVLPKQPSGPGEQTSDRSFSRDQELALKSFVLVESVCKNLQTLAVAVASQRAVLLEGPIGSGKTSLVEHLAAVTGRRKPPHLLKVQLGDQTDSKMLLGMYRCTDVPGQFVWQPGTLTQAATKGHWILLEDIDYAPLDVVSVLIPLLENGELLIPGQGDCLKVAPTFQLFATRRLLSYGGSWYRPLNSHASMLDKYWTKLHLDNLDKNDLNEVLQSRYPSLLAETEHLLDIYIELTGEKHGCPSDSSIDCEQAPQEVSRENRRVILEGRELSLRDLLNWCNRVAHGFDSTSSSASLHVFQEALDCFTAMLSDQTKKLKMAEIIGSKLNISKKKAEFFCKLYKPEIVINELDVQVGRVRLLRKQSEAVHIQKEKYTFAATRPSSVLLEQLAVCVSQGEPVLLVGETGTGKTSAVQHLARATGHHLRVVNMNQQSDTADLLGGFKPVDHKLIWLPLRESFEELFVQTFSKKQNFTFLGHIQTCYRQKRWHDLLRLMHHVQKSATAKEGRESQSGLLLKEKWEAFGLRLSHAQQQMKMTESALLFAFVEGTLAQAIKKGEWILLDEINLAAPETLECLSGLLEGSSGSLVLLDRGDTEPLVRHPDFRLFACMNPATDVGKRNLPPGIRNRFTELYVEELESKEDLQILIVDYLKGLNVSKNTVQGIVNFYTALRKESGTKLVDGTGHRPHYSLRTLCRALRFAASNPCGNVQRSLYEGFCLGFLTQLDRASHPVVQKLICQYIISGNVKSLLKQPIPEPKGGRLIQVEGYWISVGDKEPTIDETYVLTSSVKLNLRDIVRVVSAGTYPVLIQGETSVGKTSLIRWLAAATGNHCVRINNHEHTDIQEYIGCYTSDTSGKLVFNEGVLIDAMRKGYWIVLDELNLAPTDVLEALNRLLDDNRELLITETQEVVKAHPRFMLFATQNPPGLYGGRKVLSRAFRNRFVELHFDELPSSELETILHKRCSLPPSYCSKLVKVMLDLQSYRRRSSVFAGKQGFIALRDLFRWAERYRLAEQTEKDYDWLQHLANDGFMLLAGRVRKQEEADVIQEVLEKHFKKKLCPQSLFSKETVLKLLGKWSAHSSLLESKFSHVVWTEGMRRLAVLVDRALEFGEPVLLVGDTGCGKTTICQMFAALANRKLYSVNCHLNMETSDFLGGLRPVRQKSNDKEEMDTKLFEWHDGPLVLAMKEDSFFLLDEISLADDSVLERLNSVLEVEKSLVLAEKGSPEDKDSEVELLTAGKHFRILATMNPGGDFGKKELSPALRNRFTEIWCPQSTRLEDLIQIINHNLHPGLSLGRIGHKGAGIAEVMLDFIDWLTHQEFGQKCVVSIRDILSWVNFMNSMAEEAAVKRLEAISTVTSFVHAACLVYIDGIGSGITSSGFGTALLAREECLKFLIKKLSKVVKLTECQKDELMIYDRLKPKEFTDVDDLWGVHPFFIPRGPILNGHSIADYALSAGTTAMNAQRLLRAAKLNKPILLEGSPGVGKTSLVAALAKASGNTLVRINLSEQTDITDLFGTDLPVEGGKGGEFAWCDGPLLAALKAGHWVVLDELNLASQSVLEGLNACFDHRGEIYVPELGMSFQVKHEKTRIFGCQNPFRQGGGRKGLPKSFLNRFTQVFVDPLTVVDMEFIANTLFPAIDKSIVQKMVAFNNHVDHEVTVEKKWGQKGGPWEFNLRDLFRWCQLMLVDQSPGCYDPSQHVFLVYGERMRTKEDKEKVITVFKDVFASNSKPYMGTRLFHITPCEVQIGYSVLSRSSYVSHPSHRPLSLLHQSFQSLEPIMKCVQMSWMVILVGPASVGKTSLVQLLAHLTGHTLKIMAMNSAMDTTELLGGFEQVDIIRPWRLLFEKVERTVRILLRDSLLTSAEDTEVVLRAWSHFLLTYKPKRLGEDGKGVTIEIVNKLEAVLLLMQRLNNKINSYSKADFAKLVEEFRSFGVKLLQSASGRSHGSFEWVDSMLVQALKSGDWLLMDNVNFCNPSVLDRLNALLEPGGVLTINERGMAEGATSTVTPHPNFRLFLSMDPIHGEISRAMRNRGLEIYISGEGDGSIPDNLDLKVLLHSLGLVGDSVCDILLSLHTGVQSVVRGSPTSSVSTLSQTATLIVQYLQRGLSVDKAFFEACWDVYVCSQHSAANRKLVQALLESHTSSLQVRETWGHSILATGLWPDSVPSALFATEDSRLSVVRNEGQILAYCLNRMSLKTSSWTRSQPLTLQDLENIMQTCSPENLTFNAVKVDTYWVDEPEVLAMAVKLLIERATNQDWMLRVQWLCHLAKNIPQGLESVQILLEASATALKNFYSNSLSSGVSNVLKILQTNITDDFVIPLDPRWNMQSLDIIRNSVDFDPQADQSQELFALLESVANKTIIYLDREKRIFTEANLVSVGSKKLRSSVLRMSFEFHKDPESYHSLPHEIVANLAAFFELCDALILLWVQSPQGILPDAHVNKILGSLQWRDRFWTVADTVTVDAPGLALLALHWHWVLKHLIYQIPQLLVNHEDKYYKEVQTVSEHIHSCLGIPAGSFAGVKKLQAFLGRPFPFKDKLVVDCFSQLQVLNKALVIREQLPVFGECGWQEDIYRLQVVASEWNLKKSLLQAWGLVLGANILDGVNLDDLKTLVNNQCLELKSRGLSRGFPEKAHETSAPSQPDFNSLVHLTRRVQLWPATEYLAMLWQYRMTADFVMQACLRRSSKHQQMDEEIAHHITFCLKHTPIAPQKLWNLWSLLHYPKMSAEEASCLWSELFNSTFGSSWSSTVTTNPEYWLMWSPLPNQQQQQEVPKSRLDSMVKGPGSLCRAVFSKCCFGVLTSSSTASHWDISGLALLSSSHVTLGEWVERAQQLQDINSLLWTNMAVPSVADFRRTDSRLQGQVLCRHLLGLTELLPAQRRQKYVQNCEQLLLGDSQAFQHVDQTLGNMAGQEALPKEILCLLLTSLHYFFGEGENKQNLPEAAQRGKLWVNLGLLQIQTWLPQARFDPAVKKAYKLKYAQEELCQLQCEWKTRNLLSHLQTGRDLEDEVIISHSHPHIRLLPQRIRQLENVVHSLSKKQAFRPHLPSYESLVQEIHHYVTSIAKVTAVQDLLMRLLQALHTDGSRSAQVLQNLLKEEASWQQSHHQFRKRLVEEYALYPDTIAPLQASILQLQHGMRLVASEVHASLHSNVICAENLGALAMAVLAFPSVGPSFPTYHSHADALCSVNSVETLQGLRKLMVKRSGGKEREGNSQQPYPTREQLLMNALLYLRSHVLYKGELDQRALLLFRHLCQEIINEWDEQERIAQEKAEQENSLYRYRTRSCRSALSEEEEEELELRKLFPLHEKDFEDIVMEQTLEEKKGASGGQEEEEATDPALLSQSSMQAVMQIHQQLCLSFARSLWYQQTVPQHEAKHYLSLFLSCYQTGASLVTHCYPLMRAELNDQLLGSHLLACSLSYNTLCGEAASDLMMKPDGPYDFYQHPNVAEARQCQPVLQGLSEAVNQLLEDWPEHPVLQQLLVVMDRIRGFPLSSPISKLLNGLEILLAKAQDWEENASQALSLRKHLDLVSQMIIRWRKLELNCWSMSLDNTMRRHTEKSTKHWFSIYQMLEKHMQERTEEQEDDKQMTLMLLVSTLQAFIEGSSLGEFHVRLQMLLVFHCHVLLMPQIEGKDSLCSVLWNLYHFYKQFLDPVQAKIVELRSPIEKELKEFVKISKWNDVSFWSIKQSVEKTHRTLFKFMKKFEAALNEPCQSCLVESKKEEHPDCLPKPAEEAAIETSPIQGLNRTLRETLLAQPTSWQVSIAEQCQDAGHSSVEGELLRRLPRLSKRMRKVCLMFMKESPLPSLVESLDQFTGEVISSVSELQSLNVDPSAEKEKQRSEAKHILMQKHRALSDLFKHLAKIGLSYRKGLAWARSKSPQELLHLHPLDLKSALSIVSSTRETDSRLLTEISSLWDGCQKYFYRSLAQHTRLTAALATPVKEIGMGNVDRCKGFSAHLMKLLIRQRRSLTTLTEQWILLRNLLSCVQEIHNRLAGSPVYPVAFPPQDSVQQWTERLQHLAMQSQILLEQLSWLFQCCPSAGATEGPHNAPVQEQPSAPHLERMDTKGPGSGPVPDLLPSDLSYPSPVPKSQLPSGCQMRRQDQLWQQSTAGLRELLKTIRTMKTGVDKIRQHSCETLFHTWEDFEVCSSGLNCLSQVSSHLQGLESLFILPGIEVEQADSRMALVKSLEYLRGEVSKAIDDFTAWKARLFISHKQGGNQMLEESFVEDFSEQVETAIRAILCTIQNLAERNSKKAEDSTTEKRPQEEDEMKEEASFERLQPGHLTKLLEDDFWASVSTLHVQKIISSVSELLERLKSCNEDGNTTKHKVFSQFCCLLVRLVPMLCSFSDLVLFFLTLSLATHRSTAKLLSVLAQTFTELAQKGFCLPKELMEDSSGEGSTQFHDYEGGGIGDGEGMKDVSDQIENEEQVEDTFQKGQEKDKEDLDSKPDTKGEDNAIEMSEDFDGKMHDGELEEEEDDEKSDNEDGDLDKQMGNLNGEEADKLDERLWGDDDDDEEDEEDDSKAEETGPGMDEGDSELVAKDDNLDAGNLNKHKKRQDEKEESEPEDVEQGQEKINEQIDEREYDENEVDPYHGNQEKLPEPEALDLPDDLNLDNEDRNSGEDTDNEEAEEENPLEIKEKVEDTEQIDGETDEPKADQNEGDSPHEPEEGPGEDEESMDTGAADQDKEAANHAEEHSEQEEEKEAEEEEEEEDRTATDRGPESGANPADQGLQPQKEEEEEEKSDAEEEVPEATERKEHASCGQTGVDNVQSAQAVELAGAAPEKEQGKEEHGSGAADANQAEGHESNLIARLASQRHTNKNTQSFKRKPGQADNERSMGDHNEHVHKRLRTVDTDSTPEQGPAQRQAQVEDSNTFEHIKQGSDAYDAQTYDVASNEQQQIAKASGQSQEEEEAEDVLMDTEEELLRAEDTEQLKPEAVKSDTAAPSGSNEMDMDTQTIKTIEDQDPRTTTSHQETDNEKPERSRDSTIHTLRQFLVDTVCQPLLKDISELRLEMEQQLETWQTHDRGDAEEEKAAAAMWQSYLVLTASLSQQLCEQLRLLLEPTQAAKLRGDYRTGKRLNMRKIIPYIASQFRKDRIWLRRTKPSKRQYQICLAIDDSSSMVDNHTKQLAFESLAVIGNALTLLEVGQIAVCSFGESVKLLHPFHEQFGDSSGSQILRLCKFQQRKTKIAQFLESAAKMFAAAQKLSQNVIPETAQLLLIVSDGRGLFLEGKDRVLAAVQAAQNANIFLIFVVLDNPNSRDSILDIKVPIFKGPGEMPEIRSYMEEFPFPFYIILRDVNALPETLSDALRQWFELVTASDS